MTFKNYFAKNLKYLLKQNSLKQKEFAEEMCVSKQTVSAWATERTEASFEQLIAISYFFGVTIDELLTINLIKEQKND